MIRKRIAASLLATILAGLLCVSLTPSVVTGSAAEDPGAATIQLGDFWFGAPANQIPVGKGNEANIATVVVPISGESPGEITLTFQNVGVLTHEVVIPGLFETTSEVKVTSFYVDAQGQETEISTVETVGALREIELKPGMKVQVTLALDEPIVRAFESNPDLKLTFEVGCHVGHGTAADHYTTGMRGIITLTAR